MILIGLTGYFLWGGAWFFLLLLGLSYLPALLAGILLIGWKFSAIAGTFLPNGTVAENLVLGGFINLFLLGLGWIGFYKNEKLKPFWKQALFFIPVAILSGKYTFHAIPFLTIGVMALFQKGTTYQKTVLITASLIMFLMISYNITTTFPKPGTLESVQYGIQLAEKDQKQLLHDWDLGYYVEFYGFDTNFKGGIPNPDYNHARNAVMISQLDLNFPVVKDFGNYKVYEVD
jgi:hypothetical protein